MMELEKNGYMIKDTRVFSFSDRPSPEGLSGGSGGVNYRLMAANQIYHYFGYLTSIFKDCIYENGVKKELEKQDDGIENYYLFLNDRYQFKENDIFLFHDATSVIIFLYHFPYNRNSILVYHQQGTLAKEYEYFIESTDNEVIDNYNNLFELCMSQVEIAAFPSWGAIESVISSDEVYRNLIEDKRKAVLYNGCDIEILEEDSDVSISREELLRIEEFDGFKFISVGDLNDAKGVDQIPQYLYEIKKEYGKLVWVIVGHGKNDNKLMGNIIKYNLLGDVIWYKNRIDHKSLMSLLYRADFYIMTQRISIFDFATIEAMSCKCIPILTDIGGNKDFICNQNGIFINHNNLSDITAFKNMMNKFSISDLKEKNQRIAKEKFSQKAFIRGYAELVLQLKSEHKHLQ